MADDSYPRPSFEVLFVESHRAFGKNTFRDRKRSVDFAVERFMHQLEEYRLNLVDGSGGRFCWLLPFRDDFRRILRYTPIKGLRDFLEDEDRDSSAYVIAIWLMGRCASRFSHHNLHTLDVGDTSQARRHFARALFRVEAWPRLRQLASDHPYDLFVVAMMTSNHRRSLENRIARFARHVDRSHEAEVTERSRMPLWFRDARWMLSPPKSAEWLRMMLARIKEWVRGV